MKKLLGILVLGLLWCNVGFAKDLPILECEFNDNNRTKHIYELNKYTNFENWSVTNEMYSWAKTEIKNGIKTIYLTEIYRTTGKIELLISKEFPAVSDITVVLDAIENGTTFVGNCKKIEDKNL